MSRTFKLCYCFGKACIGTGQKQKIRNIELWK